MTVWYCVCVWNLVYVCVLITLDVADGHYDYYNGSAATI